MDGLGGKGGNETGPATEKGNEEDARSAVNDDEREVEKMTSRLL